MRAVRRDDRRRVVIAGGGVAALETLLALRSLAGRLVDITLVSPVREFRYRPVTVAEPFGRGEARSYRLLEIVADQGGGRVVWDSLSEVDREGRVVVTSSGERVPFDTLVVATGAVARDGLPGALTFRGHSDVGPMRELLADLVEGRARSVALALPTERMWSLPLYELALMTAGYLREQCADMVSVVLVTPEEEPLSLFGPEATRAMLRMLEARGIELRCSSLPAFVEGRALVLAGGARIYADRVVTLPRLEGPRLPGLPHDDHGFIPVDAHGRVEGLDDIFAAGDVTAFPLKQGGLASQQADAAAEMIAATAGAAVTPTPFRPVLRGLLMTGGAPLYLRSQPQLLAPTATVAADAGARRRPSPQGASSAAGQALWWPPAKIAGRYLAPYFATARPQPLCAELLTDRIAIPGAPLSDAEHHDAVDLALLLADCDARWGDYGSALSALDAAEALEGALPPEYEYKRLEWQAGGRLATS